MSISSATSLIEAQQVDSLPSVGGYQSYSLMEKSLEDVSAEIVKDTLVKVMSGVHINNENVRANSQCLVDSPSRLILVQSIKERIENEESEQMIDTPSKMNLDQINECYSKENETNGDDNDSGAPDLVDEHDNKAEPVPETDLDLESSPQLPDNSVLVKEIQGELPENSISVEEFQGEKALNEVAEEKNPDQEEDNKIINEKIKEDKNKIQVVRFQGEKALNEVAEEKNPDPEEDNKIIDEKIEEKNKIQEESTSKIMSTKELYSNSSSLSHLCLKSSETIMKSETILKAENSQEKQPSIHGRESVKSLDLSKHDLRTSVSLIDSMSDGLEHDVDQTLDSNFKKLEEKFNSEHEIETDFTAVQGMGQHMLAEDRKTSKESTPNTKSSDKNRTLEDLTPAMTIHKKMSKMEATIENLKVEVESYRTELEKIRPDSNDVVMRCNGLDIDPAIATVPHLLDLLRSASDQNSILQDEVEDYTTKLFNTTSLLDEQKHLYQELKKKLKSIDLEDDRRREKSVEEMDKYYKNKLNDIESELKVRGIHVEADFWTPHLTNMRKFLSQVHMHKDEIAEEELRRELSNAGTDKNSTNSDDEPIVFPVGGYRESLADISSNKHKYLEDDDAEGREVRVTGPMKTGKKASSQSKTCSVQ
ncbi:enolase-phosphatase E1-like [Bolinopsis microptera]|uniref:enolase-phosphatase E1-like n=1 Tax=Bolinopsis microptera TaxID=2820187 RepID=UPI00307ACA53